MGFLGEKQNKPIKQKKKTPNHIYSWVEIKAKISMAGSKPPVLFLLVVFPGSKRNIFIKPCIRKLGLIV